MSDRLLCQHTAQRTSASTDHHNLSSPICNFKTHIKCEGPL